MKTHASFTVVTFTFALILAFAGSAAAQFGPAPQGGIADPSGGGVIQGDFKTPPLADSDVITLPIDVHVPAGAGPVFNWAGVRMKMHVLDSDEVDVDGVFTANGTPLYTPGALGSPISSGPGILDPFGPRSNNIQSSPQIFTVLDPNWPGSGITLDPSVNVPAFNVTLHAKNTTPLNNSDIDLTMMFANIWHLGPQPSSFTFEIPQSWWILVTSLINDPAQLQLGLPNPAQPDTGHWLHLTDPVVFHVSNTGGGLPNPGSNLFASALAPIAGGGTVNIGIEHIPEPSRAVLLVLGASAMLIGVRARRRRQSEDAEVV